MVFYIYTMFYTASKHLILNYLYNFVLSEASSTFLLKRLSVRLQKNNVYVFETLSVCRITIFKRSQFTQIQEND